jgi:hypothetical protein
MPTTPNHEYETPDEGASDWHEPLNSNFEQHDTDIEIRDTSDSLDDYEPKDGAKFLATDTGVVYTGDGSDWNESHTLGRTSDGGGIAFGATSNTASGRGSVVPGGTGNTASDSNALAMGESSTASGRMSLAFGNEATASNTNAVAMGTEAEASFTGSAMALGWGTVADAYGAKVIGTDASANGNDGALVFGDISQGGGGEKVRAQTSNQFVARARGGFWFGDDNNVTADTGKLIETSTGAYLSRGGTWTDSSSRTVKENIEPVDGPDALEKVQSLEISEWNYEDEAQETSHCGPMAEEFHETFGLGEDDEHIASLDTAGVALAAIQGLATELEARDDRIEDLENHVDDLQAQNERLEERLATIEDRLEARDASAGAESAAADD